MAQYLPASFGGLSLLHQHNAEHLIWQRQAALERIPWRKLPLTLEARRLRRHEAAVLPRLRWLFAVSEAERRALVDLGASPERVLILPNLPDPRLLEGPPLRFGELPPQLLYVGTLNWQPNSQGLRRFLDQAYPLLRREVPEARLIIAGSEPPPWLRELVEREAGLELITPLEDVEALYSRSHVFLEPVQGGGGTKVKVLNALARGLPVVATPDGVDGIEAKADEHLLVAADAPTLVAAVRRLLEDERLWQRLSENGRALIGERYRPEVAYRPLDRVLSGAA
jgi:glycosyltransferase involved in cell wall biosynthesis